MITITKPDGTSLNIGGALDVPILCREIAKLGGDEFGHLNFLGQADGLVYPADEWEATVREARAFQAKFPSAPAGVVQLLELIK